MVLKNKTYCTEMKQVSPQTSTQWVISSKLIRLSRSLSSSLWFHSIIQHTLHGKGRGAYQLSHLSQTPSKAALKRLWEVSDTGWRCGRHRCRCHNQNPNNTRALPHRHTSWSTWLFSHNSSQQFRSVCVCVHEKTLQLVLRIQTNLSQSQLWSWESPSIYLSLCSALIKPSTSKITSLEKYFTTIPVWFPTMCSSSCSHLSLKS